MKRIYNEDIRISAEEIGAEGNFDITFWTLYHDVNISRTQEDVDTQGYINLDYSETQVLGQGVLSYTLTKHVSDPSFPDGTFDTSITRATNYYIVTNVIPIPPPESASTTTMLIDMIEDFEAEIENSLVNNVTGDEKAYTIVQCSQSDYDNLQNPDPDTIYFIEEEV